jgi:hypothetical protein
MINENKTFLGLSETAARWGPDSVRAAPQKEATYTRFIYWAGVWSRSQRSNVPNEKGWAREGFAVGKRKPQWGKKYRVT